jgi:glycosidase
MHTARWLTLCALGAGLLLSACGGGSAFEPVEVLRNGTFDEGMTGWTAWGRGDVLPGAAVVDGVLEVSPADEVAPEDMGVGQTGLRLVHGAWYELRFRASGDGVSEVRTVIRSRGGDPDPYAPVEVHALGAGIAAAPSPLSPDLSRITRRFLMAYPTDADAELEFLVGGGGDGTLRIDDVSLRQVSAGTGRAAPETEYPRVTPRVDRANLVVYEVNPFSWDGGAAGPGHHLAAITARLDRIQALGVNCIWLTPVFDGTGMGYWTRDHYEVNPELGTLDDLKRLVVEAHERDLLVILDLVVNHTWTQHPFFQDVLRHRGDSPYADWYLWSGTPGASPYAYYYDWVTLPNVNLGNGDAREYLLRVAAHWMAALDLDGWRVDCAWALEDRQPGFGAELKRRITAVKPGAFLLGEGDVEEARFFENGYDAAYDWTLRGFGVPDVLPGAMTGARSPAQLHETLARALPAGGLPLRFAENHDHPRAATLWGVDGSRVAHTIVLTSRGYPNVFGGGEVGFAPPVGRQNDPVSWSDPASMSPYVRKLLDIRRRYLRADLTQRWVASGAPTVYASLSMSGANRVLTVANLSTRSAAADLALDDPAVGAIAAITDLLRDAPVPWGGGGTLRLALPGHGTAVLLLQ